MKLTLPTGPITIQFNACDDISNILDQLPTVIVCLDSGPPDAGPASGVIYVFFIAEGVGEVELKASIAALVAALNADLYTLEANAREKRTR